MIETRTTDKTFRVQSPYNENFVKRARQLNGTWSRPEWVFPIENEPLVRDLITDIYGTDGTPTETATILVTLQNERFDDCLHIGPVQVMKKWERDRAPVLGPGCTIVQGRLLESGGSRKNPQITHTEDCIVRVKGIPAELAAKLIADYPQTYSIAQDDQTAVTLTADEALVAQFLATLPTERLQAILRKSKEITNE